MGVLFGGVTDEDTSEERLDSVFWNDLYKFNRRFSVSIVDLTIFSGTVINLRGRESGSA